MYSTDLASVYDVDNVAELASLLMPVFFVKISKKCVFLQLLLFQWFQNEFFPAWTVLAQNDERKNPDNVAGCKGNNAGVKIQRTHQNSDWRRCSTYLFRKRNSCFDTF